MRYQKAAPEQGISHDGFVLFVKNARELTCTESGTETGADIARLTRCKERYGLVGVPVLVHR